MEGNIYQCKKIHIPQVGLFISIITYNVDKQIHYKAKIKVPAPKFYHFLKTSH